MSVKELQLGKPFFTIKYVENERDFRIEPFSILINIDAKAGKDILINGIPLSPCKGTIVGHTTIPRIESAVLIEDVEKAYNDPELFDKIRKNWTLMYDFRPEERFKGVPMYKSVENGAVTPDVTITCSCVAEPWALGLHQKHPREFAEYHCQIAGYGVMEECYDNDVNTKFRELSMAPGIVHDRIYDVNGNYPWHQYRTITPSVFMAIQINR